MAKGAIAKENVTKKILEVFDGAFVMGKEIRVPILENGEMVQIKISMTCAKDNLPNPNGGNAATAVTDSIDFDAPIEQPQDLKAEMSSEEKAKVQELCERLGL